VLLAIYLNDHLAGATGVLELARRAARSNVGSDYEQFLDELCGEIEEDREALLEIMRTLGVRRDDTKVLAGWVAEKVGRLKLNGRLRSYSPYSRVLELEVMLLAVRGKLALWQALQQLAPADPRLEQHALRSLAARAKRQIERLEQTRLRAVGEAFGHSG
jgi:hypothetical protein